jgi:Rrf2 family iron-sulfur cluster assembly transcriptional regulator
VILGRPAEQITMRQIIEAVEGPINLMWCMVQPGECHLDATCPVHEVWHQAQTELLRRLDSVTLADLIKRKAVLQAQVGA